MERRYPALMKDHGVVQGRVFIAVWLEPDGSMAG